MIFGSQLDEPASHTILDIGDELGFNFIDCADVYPVPPGPDTWGRSEEIIGRWLHGRRERFVLATKFGNRVGAGSNDVGGGRKHLIKACEASLRRLQTDRIDVYWAHHSDLRAPIEETLEAVGRLAADGKILYFGVSNFEAWEVGLALEAAAGRSLIRVCAIQPRYNLLHRPAERDLLPLSRAAGLAVTPYNPLGAGMLSGKYRRGQEPPADSRFAQGDYGLMYQRRYWADKMFDVAEAVAAIAAEEGLTPAQTALGWLLSRDGVTCPIVGASRPEQLREAAAALEKPLSEQTIARLDDVSSVFT
jgi:aryl-alcohol dehydrogenase (NADP+)